MESNKGTTNSNRLRIALVVDKAESLNRFIKKQTRDRVVPTISASVS